jgi:D-alanine-D-alanine ligase
MKSARKGTEMAKSPRIKLGILFGGKSGEHEVSLTSAASMIRALNPEEYEITAIGITRQGRLATVPEVRGMLPAEVHERVTVYGALQARSAGTKLLSAIASTGEPELSPEIIFPLLHGPYGEDGTIQGLLEIAGLPYVGCGVMASAVGMDKDVMKRLFIQAGLPVPPFKVAYTRHLPAGLDALRRAAEVDLSYPMFSKPANLGSSVGVRKIHDSKEFNEGVMFSAQFDTKVLVEKGVNARELECAILGNDDARVSVVGEVIPAHEFYDYEAKYASAESRLEIPSKITAEQTETVRGIALKAFEAIDGSGLARVDFFLDRETGKVWLNEINTMPGFTPISMYSKLWAASGVPFQELVATLVRLGFERHRQRSELRVSDQWDLS